jgi:hypothetical protein
MHQELADQQGQRQDDVKAAFHAIRFVVDVGDARLDPANASIHKEQLDR